MAWVTQNRQENGVVVITLERPKANALSEEVLHEFAEISSQLIAAPPAAVVLTGTSKIFAAGAEIGEFGGVMEGARLGRAFHRALDGFAAIPRPVIAAVEGYALGGGCELAMTADFRVAAETAKFGQPEILLGIIPGGGGTQRLARLVGTSRAKELIFSGRTVEAAEAHRIGLVDRVVPAGQAKKEALAWADSLATGAVVAMGYAKEAIDRGMGGSLEEGLALEKALFAQVFATADAEIGIRSFFENGPGKARFEGR